MTNKTIGTPQSTKLICDTALKTRVMQESFSPQANVKVSHLEAVTYLGYLNN